MRDFMEWVETPDRGRNASVLLREFEERFALSRCYARAWRRAGPRGSWTKEKGRTNRTSEWSLAQERKNEQEEDGGKMLNKIY